MGQRNWDQEYELILGRAVRDGEVRILPVQSEKRHHPRFELTGGEILVTEPVPHHVDNLSASGLAFFSDRAFTGGQRIMVSLRQILAIQAEVVGCEPLTGPDAPAPFKVRCRFTDSDYGLRFLVLAMEMDEEPEAHRPPEAASGAGKGGAGARGGGKGGKAASRKGTGKGKDKT